MATQVTINPSDQTKNVSTTPIVVPSTSVNDLSPKA